MRKSLLVVLLICISLCIAAPGRPTSDTPVTTTIADYVDVVDPYPLSTPRIPMQIQSDGAGAYSNSSSVRSVIINSGGWDFDTGFMYIKKPTRRVYLDFTQPIPNTGPGGTNPVPPFTGAFVRPWFNTKCYYEGIEMLAMGAGQVVNCGLVGNFSNPADGLEYRIIMNPGCPAFPDGCLETNQMSATCTSVDGNGKCNRWTIGPSGPCVTADCEVRTNRIRLAKVTTLRGKSAVTNLGEFYMTFAIELTNP